MTRGGAARNRDEPERRCVATGQTGGKAGLIRFVLDPDGVVTPDLAEKLPGRGVWVSADHAALTKAVKKNLFAKSLKSKATAPSDLVERVEQALARRAIEAISLCRKAGQAVAGFEKCREAIPRAAALMQASDGAEDGRAKMRRLAKGLTEVTCHTKDELGLAFGRPSVIHVALIAGGATDRAVRESMRLQGFRTVETAGDDGPAPSSMEVRRGKGS